MREPLRDMGPVYGLLFANMAVIAALIDQGVINREKLIDYLLDVAADLSDEERQGDYGQSLEAMIRLLEKSQFPRDG
ncbi:hypothetical protein [Hoeflea sp.]|uniref:hypothetical protein n=1 Tax=Hoeflea sp. TaxID=1940281 RepID=UPI003BB22086